MKIPEKVWFIGCEWPDYEPGDFKPDGYPTEEEAQKACDKCFHSWSTKGSCPDPDKRTPVCYERMKEAKA